MAAPGLIMGKVLVHIPGYEILCRWVAGWLSLYPDRDLSSRSLVTLQAYNQSLQSGYRARTLGAGKLSPNGFA